MPAVIRRHRWSAYVLGSLYPQGGERFEGLLARDPGRALPLLIHAARGGELNAFAKIAEAYQDTGDALEAMAWAQAFSFLLDRTADSKKSQADGYTAALLKRSYDALSVARRSLEP